MVVLMAAPVGPRLVRWVSGCCGAFPAVGSIYWHWIREVGRANKWALTRRVTSCDAGWGDTVQISVGAVFSPLRIQLLGALPPVAVPFGPLRWVSGCCR